jgi:peptidoglycan L-alanyl-D-glutamate endopeptidase CwlK
VYSLSYKSEAALSSCHPDIQRVFRAALFGPVDFTVIEGHRDLTRQAKLYASGASQVLVSKHCAIPSNAVDVMPYYKEVPGGIDWRGEDALIKEFEKLMQATQREDAEAIREHTATCSAIIENIRRTTFFIGYIKGLAAQMGVELRNGKDWDGDGRFNDQKFIDSPHWEVIP